MLDIHKFTKHFPSWLNSANQAPWTIIKNFQKEIDNKILTLGSEFKIDSVKAIHVESVIEQGAIIKGSIIIEKGCFIGANAYLRGPLYIGSGVIIGPSCEIKQSIILSQSSIAHFNYVGDSIVGSNVNMEAGAVIANHYNERKDKNIFVRFNDEIINTHCEKFGALIGDGAKIGANAVLSPGTLIKINEIVKRLELVEQIQM
jgi:NDP-sugar pyrophosphorylase family protein